MPFLDQARRHCAGLLVASMLAPTIVCCQNQQPPPPVDDTRGNVGAPAPAAPAREGMSTKSKVVMLAGAAALYYLYKRHQTATAPSGENSQYYLSKNGRVYYRDAEHRAHWVTAPAEGIQVPAAEASAYEGFQGFNNSASGRDLTGLGTDADSP